MQLILNTLKQSIMVTTQEGYRVPEEIHNEIQKLSEYELRVFLSQIVHIGKYVDTILNSLPTIPLCDDMVVEKPVQKAVNQLPKKKETIVQFQDEDDAAIDEPSTLQDYLKMYAASGDSKVLNQIFNTFSLEELSTVVFADVMSIPQEDAALNRCTFSKINASAIRRKKIISPVSSETEMLSTGPAIITHTRNNVVTSWTAVHEDKILKLSATFTRFFMMKKKENSND